MSKQQGTKRVGNSKYKMDNNMSADRKCMHDACLCHVIPLCYLQTSVFSMGEEKREIVKKSQENKRVQMDEKSHEE